MARNDERATAHRARDLLADEMVFGGETLAAPTGDDNGHNDQSGAGKRL
jgi:hypothetical protein